MNAARVLIAVALAGVAAGATPAERKIEQAKRAIEKYPDKASPYNALAMALASRARETADPQYYLQGEEALAKSFEKEPGNIGGLRAQVWLSLGQHEFARARDQAVALNRKAPDDLMTYAFLVDANAELGLYEEAEKAAERLLNMRPGSLAVLTRTAYLRELFGDLEGALEMMNKAFQRIDRAESEDQAWVLAHVSHLQLLMGNAAVAEAAAQESLRLFPDYHYALGSLGKVRMKQARYADAVEAFRQQYKVAPHPENLFQLAKALRAAGKSGEAVEAFQRFEAGARSEMQGADNSNHELVSFYADVAGKPHEALRVAELEMKRRQDVQTLSAYAWALGASGNWKEAGTQMKRALAVGVKDPEILERARKIEQR